MNILNSTIVQNWYSDNLKRALSTTKSRTAISEEEEPKANAYVKLTTDKKKKNHYRNAKFYQHSPCPQDDLWNHGVYKISSREYYQSYIGQTKRSIWLRKEEYQIAVRREEQTWSLPQYMKQRHILSISIVPMSQPISNTWPEKKNQGDKKESQQHEHTRWDTIS